MFLKDLAKVICVEGTASENTKIAVRYHENTKRIIWEGTAKELQEYYNKNDLGGWIVVEILINHDDGTETKDYNKGKIITVI